VYDPADGSAYGSARGPAGGSVYDPADGSAYSSARGPVGGSDRDRDQDPDPGADRGSAKTGALSGTGVRPGQTPFTGSGEGDPDSRWLPADCGCGDHRGDRAAGTSGGRAC
jgi:hypothetical protein